jgi:myo-inositol catabolism protein IolC
MHMKKELFILPFDHRSSFIKDVLRIEGKPNTKQREIISHLKETIFLGFFDYAKNKKNFGILIDEEYGTDIIKQAKKEKVLLSISTEKSGKQEFEFEYGSKFKDHIKKFNPDFVKILVRYDLAQNNRRQLSRFKKLNEFCKENNYKILFELLVKDHTKTDKVIEEIKTAIQPDIWKVEGDNDWKKVIKAINKGSQIIMLGRGEDMKMVEKWIKNAKPFKEIIGFAIGRTIFLNPIKNYYDKKIDRKGAIKQISDNFKHFVSLWKNN